MNKSLVIISGIICVTGLMLMSPEAHAYTYKVIGGQVRPDPDAFRSLEEVDEDNLLRKIGELRREYKKTQDESLQEEIDELVKTNKRLMRVRESEKIQKELEKQETEKRELLSNACATYYSVANNGRTMANGEIFSNEKIVVAHTTLPIGTEVRVKSHITGNEFASVIADNKAGKRGDCPVILSKKALVEKLFDNNWDILEEIEKEGTRVEITVQNEIADEPEPEITTEESDEPVVVSQPENEHRTLREEIADLRKEYERTQNPEIQEQLEKLQEKNRILMQIKRNELKVKKAEFAAFQKGYATYYSSIFNGRKTASGEIFSNEKLTAAHRTLPLGTRVRVVCTATGNEIEVIINDRGPYSKKNRIIDLSKEAFAQLYGGDWAHLSHGIAPVEIYIIEEAN
jgi:rare lipoprotein A